MLHLVALNLQWFRKETVGRHSS